MDEIEIHNELQKIYKEIEVVKAVCIITFTLLAFHALTSAYSHYQQKQKKQSNN